MKRSFYIFISIFVALLAVSSCSFETDTVDGDSNMEGMWHLESIEHMSVADSTADSVQNFSNQRIFWSFQHDLLQLKDYDGGRTTLLCRFHIADGKVDLYNFYINQRSHDSILVNLAPVIPYGFSSLTPTFNYRLKGGRLTLSTDSTRMNFKRF